MRSKGRHRIGKPNNSKRKRKVQEMKKLIHKFDVKTDELGRHSTAYKTLVRILKNILLI